MKNFQTSINYLLKFFLRLWEMDAYNVLLNECMCMKLYKFKKNIKRTKDTITDKTLTIFSFPRNFSELVNSKQLITL